MLSEVFQGLEIDYTLDFDTSISYGACVQCAVHLGIYDRILVKDIVPYAIGPELYAPVNGQEKFKLHPLIPENSKRDVWFSENAFTNAEAD